MGDFHFRAKEVGLRAQKKILSRMATKNVAKVFIDDTAASLLDKFYQIARLWSNSKKDAEKIVKNIIKIVVKIGILYRNDQFSSGDLDRAERFQKKLRRAAVTFISFVEVEFSYDREFLSGMLRECRDLLRELVASHLTEKSLSRIDMVFNFFANPHFLDAIFLPSKDNGATPASSSPYRELATKIVHDLHVLMDDGAI